MVGGQPGKTATLTKAKVSNMSVNKTAILHWCDSVEKEFQLRESIPRGEKPKQIEEQFLATSIRYLRALCQEMEDDLYLDHMKLDLPTEGAITVNATVGEPLKFTSKDIEVE